MVKANRDGNTEIIERIKKPVINITELVSAMEQFKPFEESSLHHEMLSLVNPKYYLHDRKKKYIDIVENLPPSPAIEYYRRKLDFESRFRPFVQKLLYGASANASSYYQWSKETAERFSTKIAFLEDGKTQVMFRLNSKGEIVPLVKRELDYFFGFNYFLSRENITNGESVSSWNILIRGIYDGYVKKERVLPELFNRAAKLIAKDNNVKFLSEFYSAENHRESPINDYIWNNELPLNHWSEYHFVTAIDSLEELPKARERVLEATSQLELLLKRETERLYELSKK